MIPVLYGSLYAIKSLEVSKSAAHVIFLLYIGYTIPVLYRFLSPMKMVHNRNWNTEQLSATDSEFFDERIGYRSEGALSYHCLLFSGHVDSKDLCIASEARAPLWVLFQFYQNYKTKNLLPGLYYVIAVIWLQ